MFLRLIFQLMTEKGNHVKTRRKYESLWVDHDQMRVDFEKKIREVEVRGILLFNVMRFCFAHSLFSYRILVYILSAPLG